MPYACLERKEGESPHEVVFAFATTVDALGFTFKRLEVQGPFELGSRTFVRFRTSCSRLVIRKAAVTLKRDHIIPGVGAYAAYLKDFDEPRPISVVPMHAPVVPGFKRMYKGPGEIHWERQFGSKADVVR